MSSLVQAPETTNVLVGIFEDSRKFESIRNTIFFTSSFVQSMSLQIVMKMILPVKCSGSHFDSSHHLLKLVENSQRSESCEKCPLKLHRLPVDPIRIIETAYLQNHLILSFQVSTGLSLVFPNQRTESEETLVLEFAF